jgi:hypothetical protein
MRVAYGVSPAAVTSTRPPISGSRCGCRKPSPSESDVVARVAQALCSARAARRWQDRFIQRATEATRPLQFGADEFLYFGAGMLGRYRLVEIAEARASHASAPWFRLDAPCRFVGSVDGFVALDYWDDDVWALGQLLGTTRGYLARIDPPGVFDVIVEEDFPLADAASSHGFHDGDFFLQGDDAYDAYVRGTIANAVRALGLDAELFNGGTSHNPHRISSFRGNERAAWETFRVHDHQTILLWGYDLTWKAALRELLHSR